MAVYEVELEDGSIFDVEVEGEAAITPEALQQALLPHLAAMRQAPFPARADTPPPPLTPVAQGVQAPPPPSQIDTAPTSLIPIAQGVQAPLYPNVRTRQQPPQFRFLGEPERVEPAVSPTLRDYPAQVAGIPAPQVTAPGVAPGATAPPPGRTLATQPPTAPLQAEALAPEQASLPEKAALSVASGTGGTLRGVGSALRWLGASQTGQALSETGAATQARYQVPHKADLGWRSLLDPEYYAVNWAENLPTSLALLPVAVIGAYAGGGAAGVAGLGWFGRTILSSLFGGALSRVAESTLEAGQRYEEARAQGLPEEEAQQQANQVFGQNLRLAGLDAAQLALALYPGARGRFLAQEIRKGGQAAQAAVASLHQSLQQAGPGAVRRVLQGAGLLTAEAVIEGGEEVAQLGIQRGAAQQPTPGINPFAWDAETQEAFRQGALTGVAMGLGAKAFQSITRRAIDTLPPQLTATYATLVEQGQRQGLPSEQAQLRALDAISRTPEGQAHVAAVAQSAVTTPPAESPAVPSPPETPAPSQAPVPPDIEQSPQATVTPQPPVPIPQTKPPVPPEAAAPAREPAFVPAPPTPASRRVERFRPLIDAAATRYGLDPALLAGLIEVESGGNPDIVSPAGAKGLGQLIDSTAKSLGVTNPFDPSQNVEGAARYLAQQLQAFGGDLRLALAAYNAGPGAVRQHKGIPPFPETQRYVPAVLAAAGRYGAAIPGEAVVPSEDTEAADAAREAEATRLSAQQDAQLAQEEALLQREQTLLDAEASAEQADDVSSLLDGRGPVSVFPQEEAPPAALPAQAETAPILTVQEASAEETLPAGSENASALLQQLGLRISDRVIGQLPSGETITGSIVARYNAGGEYRTFGVRTATGDTIPLVTPGANWQKITPASGPGIPAVPTTSPTAPTESVPPLIATAPGASTPGVTPPGVTETSADETRTPPVAQPEAPPEVAPSPAVPATPANPPTTFAPGDRVQYLSNRGDRLTGTVESIGHANGSIEVNVDQTRTIGGRVRIGRVDYVQPGFLTKIDASGGQASEVATETSTPPAVDPALTVPAIDPEVPPPGQQLQLAERLLLTLQTGDLPTTITGLQTLANEVYGGTRAEGAYSPKDLYDALELAVNFLILRQGIVPTGTLAEAEATLQQLEALLNQLPTQTVRTQEQIDFQQFSTPPTYAFVANWVANIQPTDIVLEPSAGTGSLAVFAANVVTQAQVLANEVAPRRLEALQALGFTPTSDDALFLHSLFTHHGRQRPSVVVMNPPFSAAALQNRGGTRNRDSRNRGGVARRDILVGATHIEEALKLLQPGGRLVAIVGEGMAMEAPTFKTWWRKIQRQYTVRANLHIHKETYRKYGTGFGTRLLVIDNTGPQGSVEVLAPRDAPGDARAYLPLNQALTLLERIRDGRTLSTPSTEPTRPSLAPNGGPVPEPVPGPGPSADAVGTGEPGTRPGAPAGAESVPAGPGSDQPQRTGTRAPAVRQPQRARANRRPTTGPAQPGQPAAPRSSDTPAESVARPDESTVGASSGGIAPSITPEAVEVEVAPVAPTEVANPQAVDDISDSVFEPYSTAHIPLRGMQPHKGKLVQSAAMGAVPPATVTYTPHLPRDLITSGRLSAAQLEAVVYAGQAHQVLLDSPKNLADKGIQQIRKGYFIGDGTGPQPLSAKILTPTGWTTMGEIEVGCDVIAVDGLPAKVVGVFDKGLLPTYRVTFSDGASTEASGSHLWATQNRQQRFYQKHGLGRVYGPPTIRTTDEIARNIKQVISIPLVKSVQFPKRQIAIDPWLLGCLLGDGCLRDSSIQVVLAEQEMVEAVSMTLPEPLILRKVESRDYHYNIVKPGRQWRGSGRQSNPLLVELRKYGLTGARAEDKFIPDDYKLNTESIRMGVLRGLMDTDGTCGKAGAAIYYTVSTRLADDVAFIVRSLGGVVTRGIKKTTHRDCHVVYVKMPAGMNPFGLGRKAVRIRASWAKYPPRRIVRSVEPTGEKHCRCIAIDHPDHLYLTDDLIVTHNTGKGREVAGIILDNWRQGRTKAVWISEKQKLFDDARRDWSGIGQDAKQVFKLPGHYNAIPQGQGILFTTYDTLKGKAKVGEKTRIQQIVDWLGADYEGVVAFDESHALANNTATKGNRGTQQASDKALAGLALQEALPNARIVYVSATGATEVRNLGYVERLGLWGPGTDFPTKSDFITEVSAGGVGVMELVARDMKALGVYQARSLSYDDVRYERLEHTLTDEQVLTYNTLAQAWQSVLKDIDAALAAAGGADANGKVDGGLRAGRLSQFWGEHQRFFNQILTALTMPSVIQAMDADLARGDAVVIQLTNTNAAGLNRKLAAMEEGEELEDLSLTPLETLITYVEKSFPTTQIVEVADEEGNIKKVPLVVNDVPVENPEAVAIKNRLLDHLSSLYTSVPDSPLDMLINHFGTDQVAEITGRTQRLAWTLDDDGQRMRVLQRRTERQIQQEADQFMADQRRILVFSEKGGTGRSYHADLDSANQRHRRHYVVQAGWRADKAMQGLGRTHRTNQASAPTYILVTTDLPGHKRFVSSIARRLNQLGALTRGQRQTTTQGLFSERDNLESPLAEQALAMLVRDLVQGRIPDISLDEFQEQSGIQLVNDQGEAYKKVDTSIPQFLNRLLSMTTDMQQRVFEAFSERLDIALERAIQDNMLDVGMETLRADRIETVQEQVIAHDDATGADTSLVTLKLLHKRNPTTWAMLQNTLGGAAGRRDGIGTLEAYARNTTSGRVYAFLKAFPRTESASGLVIPQLNRVGPAGRELIDRSDVSRTTYTPVPPEEAQRLWDAEIGKLSPFREQTMHLMTGVLLPHWSKLRGTAARVYRVQTVDGHRYLGRTITQRELAGVLKNFGVDTSGQSTAPILSPTQAVEAVLGQGGTLYLSNDWRLGVAITGGERRIEIHGPTYTHGQQLISQGVLFERMGSRGRYFIPTDATKGPEIMRRILEQAPIVEMQFPKGAQWQETKDAMALRASQGDTRAQAIQDIMTRPREAIEASAQAADIPAQAPAYLASRHAIVRRLEQLHADMGSIPGRRRFAVGKLRGQRRGEFAVRSETIRTKLAHDLEVLAHEVGHHILKYLFHDTGALLSQTSRGPRLSGQEPIAQLLQAHRDELTALASPGESPLREGFAEFTRLYLTNPQLVSQEAPGFFAAFEQFLQETEPSLAAELQGIQRDYTAWSEQPGIHRLLGLIDYDAGRWSLPTWAGVETFFHQLYAFVAHRNHPLSRLVSEAERQLGQQPSFTQRLLHGTGRQEPVVSAEEDPSILGAVLRGASGFGDAFVTQGQLDYRSGDFLPNAPSLREVLAPLVGPRRDDTQLWEAYMLGRRALELGQRRSRLDVSPGARARAERAYQLFLRQSGMTTTVLEQTVQAAEQAYPVFAQVHDAFQHWNQGLLTYLRDSGSLSAEAYDAIVDMNQSYVPWHRVMDEGNWLSKVTGGPGRSAANVPDAVKTLRGSLRPYAPPIESAMRQAYHITRIAARQAVGRAAVDLTARLEGGGLFAVRVPAAQRVTNTSVRELQTQLARAGIDVPADAVDELLQVWRPDVWRLGKNEVTIVRDGQREVWEIRDPELYRTLLDLDRVTLQPFTRLLIAPLAFLTQVKRFSVTASPTFWLKNALFRDQATLTAQTGQAPFIGFFKNLWQAVGQGPRYQEWAANGGLLSSFADLSYPALEKRRRELLHGKYPRTHDGIVYVLKHPWEVLRLAYELSHDALNVSENATRLGIYEEAIRHPFLVDTTGRAQKLRAAAAARDGIIDFGRVGSGIQGLRLITFALGPAIGGADKMVRTLIRYPRRSAILLATMMLGSLLIRYLNEDDTPRFLNEGTGAPEARRDIYRRLPQWLRDISHIFITRKADGTPRIWAIPKTFDWGFLGHTLFERAVLDPWFNNPAQARGTLRNISTAASRQLGVNVIPDVALTYLENTYNWSSFRERPIVSRYLEGVMEAYRYDPSTSETARQLGPILGVAPVKIDNTLRQGYLAQFGLQLSDRALSAFLGRTGPTLPAKRLEEYPAMGAFLSRYPSLGAEPLQLYREAAKAIDEKKKTLKMMQQGGDPRVDTLWSDPKTQTEAAWAPWFDAMDKHHAALYAAMRAVRVDTAMSPEAKRHRLDTLTLGLIAATERFMELYRSWETASLEGRQRQGKAIEQHLQGLRTGTRER